MWLTAWCRGLKLELITILGRFARGALDMVDM